MIGNDIIDLNENCQPTERHVNKIYSKDDLNNHSIDDYYKMLSLKESSFKCLQKYINLQKFIPPHFSIDKDFKFVKFDFFDLPIKILLLDINNKFIHSIVGFKKITDYGVCDINDHRDALKNSYIKKYGVIPNLIKVKSKISPNGYSPPLIINDLRTSISFSHDGKYSAWAYYTL